MSAASERDMHEAVQVLRDRALHPTISQLDLILEYVTELEARVKHLACPICGTVNPPEVHTCTPRPRVTVTDRWAVVERSGRYFQSCSTRESAELSASARDQVAPGRAPHTVKRVALIDTDTGEGEG